MKFQFLAALATVPLAIAQGVTDKIAPKGDAPEGCQPNAAGMFEITVIPLMGKAKRDALIENRAACSGDGTVVVQLADGVLTDGQGRTGYIASNFQFQFDDPPQSGALYTAGFSACNNGSLALGDSAIFWQCASGTFYNLYDRWSAAQCSPVDILILPCDGGNSGDGGNGQDTTQTVIGTRIVTTTLAIPQSDGQSQVITTTALIPICQIRDGQLQKHTTPCAALPGAPTAATSLPSVSQIPDGQATPSPSAGTGDGGGAQETVPAPMPVPTAAPPVVDTAGAAALGGGGYFGQLHTT
ncbi:uncharacterized protein B0H64DRAFT_436105 [Chaetomium fimeti]|uniref:Cell wall mannoprotein PIR1-like C-terminal domain-containing protein n=1 Tax=Chaetomium fimeti TaxID=1854472 RepID=A0AAE0H7F6_9PEZI|nr:hypothetical protein B0H64DRAFT_436105 [Chaetomium fimeti]